MVYIRPDEPPLLLKGWVSFGVAGPRVISIVVVVAPLCEVICEFETGGISGCVLKVDDGQLLVVVLGKKEG